MAVVARAGGRAARVVVRVLVKRNDGGRVEVTEDVAAAAAVMPAGEVAEDALAGRVIADGGCGVRLVGVLVFA